METPFNTLELGVLIFAWTITFLSTVFVAYLTWRRNRKLLAITYFVLTTIAHTLVYTRPYIVHPFSPYSANDWGYMEATGHWPNNCLSPFCKVHNKALWRQIIP